MDRVGGSGQGRPCTGARPAILRVLVLSSMFPSTEFSRRGIFVERQTLELAARGDVEVQVVSPIPGPPFPDSEAAAEREVWKGLEVWRPRYAPIPDRPDSQAATMARRLLPLLRAIRRDFAFDVIAAEVLWPDGAAARHLARRLGVAFSMKARMAKVLEGRPPAARRQIARAAEAAGGMLAVSAALREAMIGEGLPGERIRVHYTGVDRDLFRPGDRAAAKATLKIGGPLLLSVGNLTPGKRQALVIEALVDLPDATLILVGDGAERERLRARAEELGVAGRLRMVGTLPQALVAKLYAAADVMVLPSATEGLANAWIEALACGAPVVITDVHGAREVVDRPAAGRIVAPEPEAIAAGVRDILTAPPDPQATAEAAARFDWARNGAELEGFLRDLLL